ncbi:Glycosyl transferase, group 2 family protein [Candidatus Rhodobacter oscarellae]|uniref:Glycosyl transferase, group 2 family protein n=1 Tax=Candidatus Rhodobacter oscarellae TaxID=1675527 RepID=A0A0J9E6W8_9RHOB|nr:TIGR04283 family arsenosugar biosynthesis glycosyltransferase [Candidatus Rhodobacter lobularis]KMW58421.1 Glycosyl transferase, group 2 family protein [Candidatus Rhodobacter lobularis]
MRAPISIVIPTLNAEGALPATLGALGEGLEAGLIRELVISDGGSADATRKVAEQAGAVWVTGAAGRGGQLRRGVEASGGDWVLVVHADTWLAPGWAEQALRHINSAPDKAGYFRLEFRAQGLAPALVAGWANLRARRFGLPYGDQGLLIARALYDEVGGYADIPLMEDVALARALRGRLLALPGRALTDAERYQREGWLRRGARNLWTLARYLLGADPARLARGYNR